MPYYKDVLGALKWSYILETRRQNGEEISGRMSVEHVRQHIENLEQKLNEDQIKEARRRADAYLYLHKHSTFELAIDREEGLPVYQYAFD